MADTISQFSELKTWVANALKTSGLTTAIPLFYQLADDKIAHSLRIRAMEASANLTVDAQTVAQPTGYLATRRIYLSGGSLPLEYLDPVTFWELYIDGVTGQPVHYTEEDENFVFGPSPDSTYTGKLLYYKRFTRLSADADTNWIISNAVGLYQYGMMLEAAPYLGDDPRIGTWSVLWQDLIDRIRSMDQKDRHSGGGRRMQSVYRPFSVASSNS